MFRNGFDFKVNDSIFIDQNGRYIFLDLTVYEQCLTLVCLYGYNLRAFWFLSCITL
jgi:hypothetical protein